MRRPPLRGRSARAAGPLTGPASGPLARLALAACLALLTACGGGDAAAPGPLRFCGIPDADKAALTERYAVVAAWLEGELGRPVEYVHAPDYTGAVTALAADKVDFAWLGGVTAVEAEAATDGQAVFLAAREADLHFRSYVVAQRDHVESGRFRELTAREPQTLAELAALVPALTRGTFSFGSKSSTSGHIMPRHFLEAPEVGLDPERDFQRPAGFQLQGGHAATLAAVASGSVDAGVLNFASWEAADAELRERAPVVYVTPEYVDYCLVGHARLGEELCARLAEAFAGLDPADAGDAAVLEAFSAQRFVRADPRAWDGIRAVLASARERGVLD